MRAIVTGQVGMDKKPYLNAVARIAGQQGETIPNFHVGDMMYARPGRAAGSHPRPAPLAAQLSLRRAAFKDIISESRDMPNLIVNTHATFRWRHGLFSAFDFDQIQRLLQSRPVHLPRGQHRGRPPPAAHASTSSTPRSRTAWSGARRRSWRPS
jgi:hypothetical protein